MKITRFFSLALAGFVAMAFSALHARAHGITPEEFVSRASASGVAEIEAAKTALEQSKSADVQKFARNMIDDHTAANNELTKIAENSGYEITDKSELPKSAKPPVLDVEKRESFDIAYANHQVKAHEMAVELFESASHLEDKDLRNFVEDYLPKLERHLRDAYQLVDITKRNAGEEYHERKAIEEEGQDRSIGVGTVPPTKYSE